MALSVGEIEAVLRARDEMSPIIQTAAQNAQTAMAGVGSAADGASSHVDGMTGSIGALADDLLGKFATALSVEKLVEFGFQMMENAQHVEFMGSMLGLTTKDIERFSYAIEQSGGRADALTSAITFMNRNLTDESPKALTALERLGLDLQTLQSESPGDAFRDIANALREVPDPMQQSADALDIFGRGAREILPAIKAGMEEIGDQAPVMDEATVTALADMERAWKSLKTTVEVDASGALAALFEAIKSLKDPQEVMNHNIEWTTQASKDLGAAIDPTQRQIGTDLKQAFEDANKSGLDATVSISGFQTKADDLQIGLRTGVIPELQHHEEALRHTTAEQDHYNKMIQAGVDTLTGNKVAEHIRDLAIEVENAGKQGGITATEEERLNKELTHMWEEGNKLPPVLQQIVDKHLSLETAGIRVKDSLAGVVAYWPNVTRAFQDGTYQSVVSMGLVKDAIDDGLAHGKNFEGWLRQLPNAWGPIKAEGDAMEAQWKAHLDAMKRNHEDWVRNVVEHSLDLSMQLIGHWSHWRDVSEQILDDLLKYYERKFVDALVSYITTGDFTAGAGVSGFWSKLLEFLGFGGGGSGSSPGPNNPPEVPLPGTGPPPESPYPPDFIGPIPPPPQYGVPPPVPPELTDPGAGHPVPKPLAAGGLVTSPTVALVGESGPEYVIPAGQLGGGGGMVNVTLELDGWTLARVLAPYIPGEAKRYSLTRQ